VRRKRGREPRRGDLPSSQVEPARRDPRVSPIYADDLSSLPPTMIIAAEYDTPRDEAEAYAERLEAAGVATQCVRVAGLVHGFLQMRGLVPDAQSATEEIARALN
jgi:acetyl esterase